MKRSKTKQNKARYAHDAAKNYSVSISGYCVYCGLESDLMFVNLLEFWRALLLDGYFILQITNPPERVCFVLAERRLLGEFGCYWFILRIVLRLVGTVWQIDRIGIVNWNGDI